MSVHLSRAEKNEMRQKYDTQFNELEELINKWDPIGLIEGGAPKDEYDCLTSQLLSFLNKNATENEIKELITIEMKEHFEVPLSSESVSGFSRKIMVWFSNGHQI